MTQRQSERGNIFFALFGAVALVGVVGAATTQLLRGPVSTVMTVNQKTKADTQMQIASKLAMVRSAQEANNGDCDGDGTIEPLAPDAMAGLAGGGAMPAAIGAAQLDPWNTRYGYCAWDLGVGLNDGTEGTCGSAAVARLKGGNNMSYPVMVIISAGADKVFQTSCHEWADATPSNAATLINKPAGSDDIILSFTYSEAVEAAGGLWSLMSGDPDTITTDKNVAFSSGVEFSSAGQIGGQATFAQNSRLDLGLGGLFLLPTDNELPDGQCNIVNNGALRLNLSDYAPSTILEMCDHTIGFVALGGAGATVAKLDDLTDAKASTTDLALFLGDNAGLNYSSTSGANNNIGIGIGAASNLVSGDGNIVLGNGATLQGAGTNSSMVIGHGIVGGGDGTLRLGNLLYGSNIYSSAGSLGIGGVPSAMLDVSGNAEADRFQFDNSTYMGYGGGDIRWFTGGVQQMILESGGNLGIGIADPNVALDVGGAAEVTGSVSADRFIAYNDGSAASPSFAFGSAAGLGMYAGSNYLGFGIGGTSEMTLDANALTVKGDGLFDGYARATSFQFSSAQGLFPNAGGLTLNTSGAPQFYLDTLGRVGVGEAIPVTALDVGGAVKIGYVPDVNCDAARAGSIRYASGDALQVCSSITGNFETIGTSGGGGGGSASYWTRISTIDPRLHYTAGFVGVGINDPQAALHAYGNFLNTGVHGAGVNTPVTGAGTRMMFVPNKSAFRAGAVAADQWDHANIGNYSVAFGSNTTASGASSFAAGTESIASSAESFAMGRYATASGTQSVAFGNEVRATGPRSVAFGLGDASIAPMPTVSGTNSFGIFMGDQNSVNIATNNLLALLGGRMIIDPDQTSATNIVPSGLLTLDVQGDVGAVQYCDENGGNCFSASTIASGGVGIWEDASNIIRLTSGTVSYASASYVFGAPQMDNDGIAAHNARVLFNKSKAAFRAGTVDGNWWDAAEMGNASIGLGFNTWAKGDNSIAIGNNVGVIAAGGMALGQEVDVEGINSVAFGLGSTAGVDPKVTGARSFGIFMGDQGSVNFSSSNVFGLFGGKMVIDPRLPALKTAPAAALTFNVEGQIGATEYCDANGLNCFNPSAIGSANGADGTIQYASGGKFWSSPTFMYSSASGGRVGIGTAAPSQALHVVGSVRATQSLILDAVAGGAPSSLRLVDLGDTTITAAAGGDIIKFDSATNRWVNMPSSSMSVNAAGANRQIQFNDNGAFGANGTFVYTSAGRLGLGTATPSVTLDINAVDAILVPRGVDGQRPTVPVNGMFRYNSTNNKFEGYQNGWQDILTGAATSSFLSLTDTPSSYATANGQFVRVNAGSTALEFTDNVISSVTGQPLPSFISLDDLGDVNLSVAPTNGQVLSYNGTSWVAAAAGGGGPAAAAGADRQMQFNSGGSFGALSTFVFTSAGRLGLGTATPSVTLDINATDAILVPRGVDGQRPTVPVNGMFRYNSTNNKFEGYQNGWQDILTGGATVSFVSLTDTPSTYLGAAGQYVRVNAGTNALEFTDQLVGTVAGQPAPTFISLNDLSNVDMSVAPTGGQSLVYDSAASRWKAGAAASGAGIPSGANTQIQFNSAGAFGGSANFIWNNATNALSVTGKINVTDRISIAGTAGAAPPIGMMLSNLGDVDLSVTPTGGQSLVYDSAASRWKAGTVSGGGGGTPAGLTTQVQYNNAGAFGADSGMTYSTGSLTVTGSATPAFSATSTANSGRGINALASGSNTTYGVYAQANSTTAGTTGVHGLANGNSGATYGVYGRTNSTSAGATGVYGMAAGGSGTTYGVYGTSSSANGFALYGAGNLHVTGNISYVGTLTDTSDMRLKTDIHPLRNRGSMLEKIGAIDTYSFRMKDEATRQIEFGVMAQELEKIFPELVKVDQSSPEKYMSVNYIGLITPLISATQELKAENDNLKAKLNTLETRMASMETDIQGMKVHTGYGIGRAEIGLWMVAGMGGFMILFFFGGKIRRRIEKV